MQSLFFYSWHSNNYAQLCYDSIESLEEFRKFRLIKLEECFPIGFVHFIKPVLSETAQSIDLWQERRHRITSTECCIGHAAYWCIQLEWNAACHHIVAPNERVLRQAKRAHIEFYFLLIILWLRRKRKCSWNAVQKFFRECNVLSQYCVIDL